jgi:hypothetical protein
MGRIRLSAFLLALATCLTAVEPQPAGVLITGWWGGEVNHQLTTSLRKEGFAVRKGGNDPALLTWEQVRQCNVLILQGLGDSHADGSLTQGNLALLALVDRFLAAGGGVLWMPRWVEMAVQMPPQREFARRIGLDIDLEGLIENPGEPPVVATPWQVPFALTRAVATAPGLTDGVTALWFPIATRLSCQQHVFPIFPAGEWQSLVGTPAGTEARHAALTSFPVSQDPHAATTAAVRRGPALAAARQIGRGRLAVLGVTEEYLFGRHANTTFAGIVGSRGLNGVRSDGDRLVLNLLRWLAEPSRGSLGGQAHDPALERDPARTVFGQPWNWQERGSAPAAQRRHPGVLGARSAASSGSGRPEEWVARAKALGLTWLVFCEEFAAMDRGRFETLKADCARLSDSSFAAIPGFAIDDEVGHHYFYAAPALAWPSANLLDPAGRVFTSFDPSQKDPRTKGQLNATTLAYANGDSGHLLTAGVFRLREVAPFADFFANYDVCGVVATLDGRPLADDRDGFLRLVASGQQPLPVAVSVATGPERLGADGWRTVLRLPGDSLAVAKFWGEWHFYPENPVSASVSRGPEIERFAFAGPRDYEGSQKGWFVWQNLRWRLEGEVSSETGLREVSLYDGTALFRRWTPEDPRRFSFALDLDHGRQHNLVLVATDLDGNTAISGDQVDRHHGLEMFMCSDRNNQLTYGMVTASDGTGIQLGGNQESAAPNHRLGGDSLILPGLFLNDANLGSPGFDGAAWGHPEAWQSPCLRTPAGELAPPSVVEGLRVLTSVDLHIGEGRQEHRFTDGIAALNVWHTLWRTTPADDFTVTFRRHLFNLDPDRPVGTLWLRQTVTQKRDLGASEILSAGIKHQKSRQWAVHAADGVAYAGSFATDPPTPGRSLDVDLGLGGYAAVFDSPLGGVGIWALSPGIRAKVSLPAGGSRAVSFCAAPTGNRTAVDLLVVGLPRTTARTAAIPTTTTEGFERFHRDFGMASGKPAYSVAPSAGTVTGQRYILEADGTRDQAFAAILAGDLCAALPIAVRGLNDRWTAVLADRAQGVRPLGVGEGVAWATVALHGKLDLAVGHPVTADDSRLAIQVTRIDEAGWRIEVHNPLGQPVQTGLRANPALGLVDPTALPAGTVEIPAGRSLVYTAGKP